MKNAESGGYGQARSVDQYFSADVETDGPIPGPYSILSFALVFAGSYDGQKFVRPKDLNQTFYAELKPISENYQDEGPSRERSRSGEALQRGPITRIGDDKRFDMGKATRGRAHTRSRGIPLELRLGLAVLVFSALFVGRFTIQPLSLL
jgi:hypothetical protein